MEAKFTKMEFPINSLSYECTTIDKLSSIYTNSTAIYYHMSDNDGNLSGEMLGRLFNGSELVPFTYHRKLTIIKPLMVFVDVTPDFDQLVDLYRGKYSVNVEQILIIDHHKDRYEYYKQKLQHSELENPVIIYIYSEMPATYMVGKIAECLNCQWYSYLLNTIVEAVSLYDVSLNDKPDSLFKNWTILRTKQEKNCSDTCYNIEFWCRNNSMQIIKKCTNYCGLRHGLQQILLEGNIIKNTYTNIAKLILNKYQIDLSNKKFVGKFKNLNQHIDKIVMCNIPNYDFGHFFESKPNEIAIAFTYVDTNKISVNCFSSQYDLLKLCPGLGGHPSEAGCEIQEISQLFIEK